MTRHVSSEEVLISSWEQLVVCLTILREATSTSQESNLSYWMKLIKCLNSDSRKMSKE